MITVENLEDESGFDSLRTAWDALQSSCDCISPFVSFDWMRTWWDHFGDGHRLFILACRKEEKIVAIAPLMLVDSKRRGVTRRTIRFIGSGLSDRLGVLADEGEDGCFRAMAEHLQTRSADWDEIELRDLREEIPSTRRFADEMRQLDVDYTMAREVQCPFVKIDTAWEEFYNEHVNKRARRGNRSKLKALNDLGRTGFRRVVETSELSEVLDAIFSMPQRYESHFDSESKRSFYRTIAERFSLRGWLALDVLELEGKPIAYRYGFLYRDRYFDYLTGFDPEWESHLAGRLLMNHVLEQCFQSELKEVDFLRGFEPWKAGWTEDARWNARVHCVNGSLRSRLVRFVHTPREEITRTFGSPQAESTSPTGLAEPE